MRRKLAPITTNIVAEVFIVVDGLNRFSKTPLLVSGFNPFHRTYVQAIAQKQFLVKRG